MLGRTLGSYKIVEQIGEGGMGIVYAAEHTLLGRKAAVKVLLPELCHNDDVVQRFFNEARAAALIKNPGIVDIFDFGHADDGSAYIIMEFIDGESLADRLGSGSIPHRDATRSARQLASALSAAHKAGIVHRDLKPDNILLVPDSAVDGGERAKILDFGIAKLTDDNTQHATKTQTGMVMGSPHYMAPEQCKGAGVVDARTDVYALGCVMYHMVCGKPPFDAEGAGEILAQHIFKEPAPPSEVNPRVSPVLEGTILRAMAKSADDRYGSMEEMISELDGISGGRFATAPTAHQDVQADPEAEAERMPATTTTRPPTTLGSSVAEVHTWEKPPTSRSGWFVAAGVTLLFLAVGAGALTLAGRGGKKGDRAEVATAEGAATGAAVIEEDEARKITITLITNPAGANVHRASDDKLVGQTPYTVEREVEEGELGFVIRREGFEEYPVSFALDRDQEKSVSLVEADTDRRGGRGRAAADDTEPGKIAKRPEPAGIAKRPEPSGIAKRPEPAGAGSARPVNRGGAGVDDPTAVENTEVIKALSAHMRDEAEAVKPDKKIDDSASGKESQRQPEDEDLKELGDRKTVPVAKPVQPARPKEQPPAPPKPAQPKERPPAPKQPEPERDWGAPVDPFAQ